MLSYNVLHFHMRVHYTTVREIRLQIIRVQMYYLYFLTTL